MLLTSCTMGSVLTNAYDVRQFGTINVQKRIDSQNGGQSWSTCIVLQGTFCILQWVVILGSCNKQYLQTFFKHLLYTTWRQQRRLPPWPWSLPWCPWNANSRILQYPNRCPLPRRKCLGVLALSKTKHTGLWHWTHFFYLIFVLWVEFVSELPATVRCPRHHALRYRRSLATPLATAVVIAV